MPAFCFFVWRSRVAAGSQRAFWRVPVNLRGSRGTKIFPQYSNKFREKKQLPVKRRKPEYRSDLPELSGARKRTKVHITKSEISMRTWRSPMSDTSQGTFVVIPEISLCDISMHNQKRRDSCLGIPIKIGYNRSSLRWRACCEVRHAAVWVRREHR